MYVMVNVAENNKRIAKNTLLLYVRTLLMILINLYTQRVVLNTLGVEDFGINNVVAGVITMLGFLNASLGAASSRYITYDLGRGDLNAMKKTFGNILSLYTLLAVLVLILGETLGLWFMTTQLHIPSEREFAAFWVYQFSILSFLCSMTNVPYNSLIIAHERMSAFAYIGIGDAILKLLVAFILLGVSYDKLITYAALLLGIQLFDRIIYRWYCRKYFEESHTSLTIDKGIFKEIFYFAGWTMNGNLAVIGFTQGLNVLLNIFFGPLINAARGIAVQIQNVVMNFCVNFQMALNPQLTKSYVAEDYAHMHQLLKASSKYSFYLMLLICLPVMLEAHLILQWWLGVVPEHTVNFVRLILGYTLLYALSNPIIISVHATGRLKRFQLIEGGMLLSIVPIAYILLKCFHVPPESVFVVHLFVEICTQIVRIQIVLPMIQMRVIEYIRGVAIPILKVLLIAPILPIGVFISLNEGLGSFFIVCIVSVSCVLIVVYLLGCTAIERMFLKDKVYYLIRKII